MGLLDRLANLWRRESLDAEIDEELRSHLDMAVADAVRSGLSPEEALRQAKARFGSPVSIRERTAEADTAFSPTVQSMWPALRHAWRTLRRTPVFTVTAIL